MICFQGGNSYEDELLQQIRDELKQDDEIEEMLQDLDKPSKASKSKRPTSKLGNKYIDAAKQIPIYHSRLRASFKVLGAGIVASFGTLSRLSLI